MVKIDISLKFPPYIVQLEEDKQKMLFIHFKCSPPPLLDVIHSIRYIFINFNPSMMFSQLLLV